MDSMKNLCKVAMVMLIIAGSGLATYAYIEHVPVFYAWSGLSFLVSYVSAYGTGFFSGWHFGHEEARSVYRK